MSTELKNITYEEDRFRTDHPISRQVLLSDDLHNDNLIYRPTTHSVPNKSTEKHINGFLVLKDNKNGNKTKQNGQILLPDKREQSKSMLNKKQKYILKCHFLHNLINKIKQLKLTKHNIVMIILNILMFISLVIVYLFLQRSPRNVYNNVEEILLVKRGIIFGGVGGYIYGNDVEKAALNFTDTITSISAFETTDHSNETLLLTLTFMYSNGKQGTVYGGEGKHTRKVKLNTFYIYPGEHISQIIIYEGGRKIVNAYREGKLTYLIVGIYFETNSSRSIMYGSKNGRAREESPKNYFLASVQGKFGGYIDILRFTWYKYCLKNSTISEEYN